MSCVFSFTCQRETHAANGLFVLTRTQPLSCHPDLKEIIINSFITITENKWQWLKIYRCDCKCVYSPGWCYVTSVRSVEQIPFERSVNDNNKPVEAAWMNTFPATSLATAVLSWSPACSSELSHLGSCQRDRGQLLRRSSDCDPSVIYCVYVCVCKVLVAFSGTEHIFPIFSLPHVLGMTIPLIVQLSVVQKKRILNDLLLIANAPCAGLELLCWMLLIWVVMTEQELCIGTDRNFLAKKLKNTVF